MAAQFRRVVSRRSAPRDPLQFGIILANIIFMTLFRRTVLLLTALAPVLCAQRGLVQIEVQRKLALVIGNSDYPKAKLANPVNDAAAMETTLKRLGFEVTVVRNADLRRMRAAIDDFAGRLE